MKLPSETQAGWFLLTSDGAREALIAWFKTLRFRHSVTMHILVTSSLEWPEVQAVFFLAAPGGDFTAFAHGVLREARYAREAGRVVPAGLPRKAGGGRKPKPKLAGVAL